MRAPVCLSPITNIKITSQRYFFLFKRYGSRIAGPSVAKSKSKTNSNISQARHLHQHQPRLQPYQCPHHPVFTPFFVIPYQSSRGQYASIFIFDCRRPWQDSHRSNDENNEETINYNFTKLQHKQVQIKTLSRQHLIQHDFFMQTCFHSKFSSPAQSASILLDSPNYFKVPQTIFSPSTHTVNHV